MAKADNIIQQIRNAQAAAIAKNGGITANSYAKVEADTKSILQKQIAQQQSAKKETSGQAETPALPEVQDTRTTQQKHDDAKKAYDDYVSSDEYKQNQVANLKAQTDEWMNATIAGSEGYTPTPRKDQKEQQLKAEADYWKAQVEAEENQKVMDADLEELAGWSEQDRRALEQYATGQDVDFYNTLNFAQNGIQVGTAEQNAAGLFEKYGKEKVDQIAESFKRNQSQKLTQETAEAGQKHGDEHAVLSSLGSVATNTVGGVTGVLSYIRELGQRSGRYSTLDPNSIGNLGNVYSGAVRGQVAQNIAGEDGSILRQGAAYLYQGGMTIVDSFARAAAGGGPGGAAALAACNAFSQTVSDASRQGATPEQAYTLGVAVAGIEYLSEKIPMDEVFKLAKGGKTNVLMQAFKQAGIEISTEELSLLGSMAAEAAILQEKSSYKQQIGDLVAGGASYEEAKTQADKAVWEEVKQTALVSGFAGSLSGGGAAIVGNLATNNAPEVTEEVQQEPPVQTPPEAPVVEPAQQTGPTVEQLLDGVQDMTPAPEPLSEEQQRLNTATSLTLDEVFGKMNSAENVASNSMANAVLNDPVALEQLVQQAMVEITGTKAEQRRAVKEALNRMFNSLTEETVDSGAVQRYNNTRSEQVQGAIDRLNSGGDTTPTIEEIMSIPEIAEAERANDGPETINLPNREQIRENGYQQAMQKGSWNGKDYSGEVQRNRRMDIVIGLPGSGKSSVYTERLSQEHKSRVIDTDDFREYIPEYNGSNASVVHEEASNIRNRVLLEALDNGDNLLLSTIGANGEKLAKQIAQFKEDGYQVYLHLNELPNNKSLARAIGRHISEDGKIGRYVSPQLIAAYGDKPTETYLYLTGQGGNKNGGLGSDLRTVGGQSSENAGGTSTAPESTAVPADLLAGYDWYNNDVARGEAPRLIQSSEQSTPQADMKNQSAEGGQITGPGTAVPDGRIPQTVQGDVPGGQRPVTEQNPGTVGAMQSQFKHEVKQSKVYGNTYQNTPYADIHDIGRAAKKADPNIDQYDVITEAESVHEAELRTETGRDRLAEHRALMKKDGWTGADNDTAMRLLTVYRREGKKDRFLELSRKQRQMGTQAGQMVQSFAKYSREDATVAVQDAIADLDELTIDQVDRTFWKPKQEAKGAQGKKDAFQKWKESITGSLLEVANDIENVEDGDKAAMKDLVRQIANLRHTTAWAGYSSDLSRRTERGLDKMDFDTLKTVAKTQLSMIPNDFRKRDTGEILKQIRVQNMLFTLTTKFKNDASNITNGIMDAISDSFGGRMIDAVIGEWTGKRTVGNDLKYATEYSKAARDAADVASAFVSLDIPMEVDAKYSSGRTRTWTPNTTNVFGRLMSAYEKHMKYALEVSDKFYEGGAAHVVNKSLQSLGEKSGLTPEQIQDIAQKTGERRTFKDPGASVDKSGQPKNGRMLARANVGLQKALNNIGTENIGLGDMVMPFAAVSGEVKQVGMDYTGGGLISGMKEIISIAKDVRNGKEIDPYRQRTAATNFGRGMTGVGLITAFTAFAAAGAVKVHNDRDSEERMMNQTQGLSGAQWNLNSSLRWWEATMNGSTPEEAAKAAEWQSGDELITIDFLEPYNTQMHIGYLLSQGEDIPTAIMQGNFNSLLEMPMMQTLSDLADLQQAFTEVSDGDMDGVRDAAGQLVGTVAGSIVPNWMRKTAQVIDPYYRDTYDTNPFRKAAKEVVAATPILSAALPKKYDNLGKEQRRFDESEWMTAAFDNLVTPWDTDTYQTNPVYQEIERLNAIDGINVTPPQAKRKITYTDNTGKEHKNYNLSSEQYETMQKVQGQTSYRLMFEVISNSDYAGLTDKQKAEVISDIYSYAREQGLREALPNRFSDAEAWIDDIQGDPENGLIRRATLRVIHEAIENTVNSIENDWSVSPAAKQNLDALYDSFDGLSKEAQKQILDDAVSDTAKYLEIRSHGINTEQYLDVVTDIKDQPLQKGYSQIRDAQTYHAIAENDSLSNVQKDYVMKAYMPDYDPNAKKVDRTELKYDYMIEEGYSRAKFATAYDIYSHEKVVGGEGTADRTRERMCKELNIKMTEAKMLYKLFGGYYKPWE